EAALRDRLDFFKTNAASYGRATGQSAAEVAHEAARTWERLGTVRVARKDWNGAAVAFREAAARFADLKVAADPAAAARVHRNLARAAAAKGDFAAAVEHQATYLAAKPPGLTPLTEYA